MSKGKFIPDGSVRRSQVLLTAGPGAVVDLVDHAVMLKGLDSWRYQPENDGFVPEPRLEGQVLSALKGSGHWNHNYVKLRLPPRCEDDLDTQGPWRGMHARRFPAWYLCRTCRGLVKHDEPNDKHVCHGGPKARGKLVPVRFVSGCRRGHVHDIHWRGFVHRGQLEEGVQSPYLCHENHDLGRMRTEKGERYTSDLALVATGSSGELSDLVVLCRRCGQTRSLQDLRHPNALGSCKAWRPWLDTNDTNCEEPVKLLIRTGSNVWFPLGLSVLSIPDSGEGLRKKVSKHWDLLAEVKTKTELTMLLDLLKPLKEAFTGDDGYAVSEVLDAIFLKRAGRDKKLPPIREAEWKTLMSAEYGYDHDLPPKGTPWHARRLEIDLPSYLDRVVLVDALREVRALVGFRRIESGTIGQEGEPVLDVMAPLSENQDWVPAVEVRGEGVFLAFDETHVREWEEREAVREREEAFRRGLRKENEGAADPSSMDAFTSARLLMLHSLSHMLITQISLECGYSASAIRERIYCYRDPEDPAKSRAGILLYTGTPGSEGTLGGLVEVGKEIVRHLQLAVERNIICSNDPVCAQHDPDGPEDGRRREGAACHGCLLIAEPSCERMNRDLDRSLVVETLEGGAAAFLPGKTV